MWGRAPVLLQPFPSPSLFLLSPFHPLPSSSLSFPSFPFFYPPFLRSKQLLQLGSLGRTFGNPQRVQQRTAAKQYLVNFRLKILPIVATIIRSFSGNVTSNCGGIGLSCWTAEGLFFEYRCGKRNLFVYIQMLCCCMLIYALSDTANLVV